MFALGPDGMVENDTLVTQSKITAYFHIKNQEAYDFYKTTSFSFEIALYCDELAFLSNYISSPSLSQGISSVTLNTPTIDAIKNNELITTVSVSNLNQTGEKTIIVEYVVNDVTVDKKSMAQIYYNNKPKFTFKVRGN